MNDWEHTIHAPSPCIGGRNRWGPDHTWQQNQGRVSSARPRAVETWVGVTGGAVGTGGSDGRMRRTHELPENIEEDGEDGEVDEGDEGEAGGGGPLEVGEGARPRLGEGGVGRHRCRSECDGENDEGGRTSVGATPDARIYNFLAPASNDSHLPDQALASPHLGLELSRSPSRPRPPRWPHSAYAAHVVRHQLASARAGTRPGEYRPSTVPLTCLDCVREPCTHRCLL